MKLTTHIKAFLRLKPFKNSRWIVRKRMSSSIIRMAMDSHIFRPNSCQAAAGKAGLGLPFRCNKVRFH